MAWGQRPHRPRGGARRVEAGLAAIVLAMAGIATNPAAGHAFELFGYTFFGGKQAEPIGPDAQPYNLEVVVDSEDSDVVDLVRNASRLYRERDDPPPPSTAALINRAQAEYARIVGALYTVGRYGPVVRVSIGGQDPFALEPDAELPDPVPIRITVDPGPEFRFGKVRLVNRAPPPQTEDDVVEPSDAARLLEPGEIARSPAVLATERLMVEEWRQQGYPKAVIDRRNAVARHPVDLLDVTIVADSGPLALFGDVDVSGTETMDPDFVIWMTGIRPGAPYDPDVIARAERNLRRLGVFASTRFTEADQVGPDGLLPLQLAVAERPLRAFGAGATYSTVDGAGIETYWEHRNLFGKAEKLRFDARVGGIDSVDPNDFNYFLGASFLKPGVFTPFTDFNALVSAEQNDYDTYNEKTVRVRAGLSHEVFEGLKISGSINIEASEIEDAIDTRQFLLASLPTDIDYDGRDDPLDPTRGVFAHLGLEPFYEFEYGNAGLIADAAASTYWSFDGEGRYVLAVRGAVGSVIGAPSDEIPESRLFFAGGGGSVRGYSYRSIGPEVNGDVVGGRSYVEGSLELRAKVTDSIGIVPFIDAGSAFDSPFPDFSEDIQIGAGIGLRYYTGLGPIRADIAVPLNPRDGDPSFAVYIGLGQSF